ncbi:MAG: 2-hydroxyacid dehydrogenase [Clostridiaceae bacterium]|nr:2-hydroxyacid dehydrogenase [Clostridiaceae bacterium]
MIKNIGFFDTKPYDKVWFDRLKDKYRFEFKYFESKLNGDTAMMCSGLDGVVAFVNDVIDKKTIDVLNGFGIKILALRCAGYNNVDFKAAFDKIHVVRVPAYSPHAVAEHAMALILTLNRKIHRAYIRTRDFNFSINGFTGFDLYGKTMGIIGTGKIGRVFADICKGFGMKVIAHDPFPAKDSGIEYVGLDELFKQSDIISLHAPLTRDTYHIIDRDAIGIMKDGAYIVNTSRGALVDSEALLEAIKDGKIGGACLDVYEEESDIFYEDYSNVVIKDDILARLISMPNVIVTSHQAFLTDEALKNIAETTLENLKEFFDGKGLTNEICYRCAKYGNCTKKDNERCF